jgi:hypothetical protein
MDRFHFCPICPTKNSFGNFTRRWSGCKLERDQQQ